MSLWVVDAEEEEDMVVVIVEGSAISMVASKIALLRNIGEKFANVYLSTEQFVKHQLLMEMEMGTATDIATDTTTVIKNTS
ncbi:hypothetical protein P4V86_10955 [Brevibacillus laterosporus]|uniref:hypothetical protein n=1 Tax=Brevibacillus laterosporus TaxID=1465 RepID=UPI000379BF16|nr:hypothetical protein [Brevibacillus laterosporus]ATO48076.1 hypothetical protein BrL25_02495 [Brevibacillus laterosporus DSM 25]MED2003868.1 hypothetical protein [Brevibacillus laterosporus]MED4762468.1 hypothetical protein [Brevibacillus laterosporus]